MKHARFLEEQLSVYPDEVRFKCINYNKWKLWIKSDPEFVLKHWKTILAKDCRRIDKFLYPMFNANIPTSWVRHLSILNTDTFYKICKKMTKKLGIPEPADYYTSCVRNRTYKMTAVSFHTLL